MKSFFVLGKSTLVGAIILLLSFFSLSAYAAVTLVIDGTGQLLGANSVEVNGSLYDVQFLDGTCIDLYDGCDEQSDFTFSAADASAPSEALWNQVFIQASVFDFAPNLTSGCDEYGFCNVMTPSRPFASGETSGSFFQNTDAAWDDDMADTFLGFNHRASDLALVDYSTYAVWTPTIVPIPGALIFFGSALTGLGFSRRLNR